MRAFLKNTGLNLNMVDLSKLVKRYYLNYFGLYLLTTVLVTPILIQSLPAITDGRFSNLSHKNQHILIFFKLGLSASIVVFLCRYARNIEGLIRTKFRLLMNPTVVILTFVLFPSFLSYFFPLKIDFYFKNLFSIGHIQPNFGDLRGVLIGATRLHNVGDQIPCRNSECVPTTWIYGRSLFLLPNFEVSEPLVVLISLWITFLFLSIIIAVFPDRLWLIGAFFISPPIVLLFERQNIEIILVIVCFLSVYFYSKKKFVLAFLPILCGTLIKFYPLGLIIFFSFRNIPLVKRISIWIMGTLALLIITPDIYKIKNDISPGLLATYGFENLRRLLSFSKNASESSSILLNSLFLFIAFILFVMSILLTYLQVPFNLIFKSPKHEILFVFFSFIFILSYFTNSNYAYRLIYLVIALTSLAYSSAPKNILLVSYLLYFLFLSSLSTIDVLNRNLAGLFLSGLLSSIILKVFLSDKTFFRSKELFERF